MDICDLSAIELSAALRRRDLSAVDALEAVLLRADEIAGTVNPFSVRLDQRARQAARIADALLARGAGGPLCGVPVTTKDSHWMAGIECTSGSRTRKGFVPTETVGAISRLEAAGAVVFARTTVPEFCYFGITESELFGRTSNPWNLDRTAGGSSGGAAAAVAAGCGPLSLGGDGGGSIRIPAAFCGIVGFKPTFGLVPHEPSSPGWKTLVALGPMARTVADARLMLAAVAGPGAGVAWTEERSDEGRRRLKRPRGPRERSERQYDGPDPRERQYHGPDPRDRHGLPPVRLDAPAPDPGDLRVVVSEDLGFAPLDEDVRRAFRAAVGRLEAAGVRVVRDAPGLGTSIHTWSAIALAEAYHSEQEEYLHRSAELGAATVEYLTAGSYITAGQYIEAQFARERIHRTYADLFARTGAAVLITPTLGCAAFPHGRRYPDSVGGVPVEPPDLDWAPFLYDGNLAGLPACALPMGFDPAGLPVSLQVVGQRCDDGRVLAAAQTIEQVLGVAAPGQRPGLAAT